MNKIDKILIIILLIIFASLIGSSISASIAVTKLVGLSELIKEQAQLTREISEYLKIISDKVLKKHVD